MTTSHGYAAHGPETLLTPFTFERRAPRERDVAIEILYCGVCHSDIHQVRNEWGGSIYPMVPGHEIVGRVTRVGAAVTKFRVGDLAGVGVLVDSCRTCPSCKDGLEQFCQNGWVQTYNSLEKDGKTPTYGGYADTIVVDEAFTLRVSSKLELARIAPLLCAGITTYSPLRHWKVGAGQTVGIVGLGGLGHMAVKFARSFGAEVVVFTTSPEKRNDAVQLGAHEVVVSRNPEEMRAHVGRFDLILDTVAAPHDLNAYLELLRRDADDGPGRPSGRDLDPKRARAPAVHPDLPAPAGRRVPDRGAGGDSGDARLLRRPWDRLRRRGDPHPGRQRGVRADAQGRREVPVRARSQFPEGVTAMTIIGAVFWVFVILPHPTSVNGPYETRAACEARRRTLEPGVTTGCHLMTLPASATCRCRQLSACRGGLRGPMNRALVPAAAPDARRPARGSRQRPPSGERDGARGLPEVRAKERRVESACRSASTECSRTSRRPSPRRPTRSSNSVGSRSRTARRS